MQENSTHGNVNLKQVEWCGAGVIDGGPLQNIENFQYSIYLKKILLAQKTKMRRTIETLLQIVKIIRPMPVIPDFCSFFFYTYFKRSLIFWNWLRIFPEISNKYRSTVTITYDVK
jgi:hypothetical protein